MSLPEILWKDKYLEFRGYNCAHCDIEQKIKKKNQECHVMK